MTDFVPTSTDPTEGEISREQRLFAKAIVQLGNITEAVRGIRVTASAITFPELEAVVTEMANVTAAMTLIQTEINELKVITT